MQPRHINSPRSLQSSYTCPAELQVQAIPLVPRTVSAWDEPGARLDSRLKETEASQALSIVRRCRENHGLAIPTHTLTKKAFISVRASEGFKLEGSAFGTEHILSTRRVTLSPGRHDSKSCHKAAIRGLHPQKLQVVAEDLSIDQHMWVVVKSTAPFWVLSIFRHLVSRGPKKDHDFDNHRCTQLA